MYLFSARDVSQRVQLRETRAAFVANASHELKTPLTVVNGYLELLADDKTLPNDAQEKIAIAEKHALRMSDIVTDLLTLSKLENQQLEKSKLVPVAVGQILNTLVAELSVNTVGKEHLYNTHIDEHVLVQGSETEIKSVCTNLLYNAVQHTPAGTEVQVKWIQTGTGAQLVVSDDGQGIPPQHLLHITERFYRVDSEHSRESGGTGLGLSIVKHIVNRHRGQFDITSEPGQGTEFSIRFPTEQIVYGDDAEPATSVAG